MSNRCAVLLTIEAVGLSRANPRLETTSEYLDVLTEFQITRVRMPETTLFSQNDDQLVCVCVYEHRVEGLVGHKLKLSSSKNQDIILTMGSPPYDNTATYTLCPCYSHKSGQQSQNQSVCSATKRISYCFSLS